VLECYRPATHAPHKPLVIVQHGQSRNGREYCDAWIPVADLAGFLVVAITFPKSAWPDALQYNNGHVLAETERFAREKPGRWRSPAASLDCSARRG
jgi:poly(3-hydroxybutyrate) depolymerase